MPVIYQVKQGDLCIYVGSTIKTLCKRIQAHKMEAKTIKATPFHKYVYDNGGWDNFQFSTILKTELIGEELKWKERQQMEILKPLKNTLQSIRTSQECVEYDRQLAKKQHQTIYECPCGKNTTESHKQRHFKSKRHQVYLQETTPKIEKEKSTQTEDKDADQPIQKDESN